jgi:hypothetical protein
VGTSYSWFHDGVLPKHKRGLTKDLIDAFKSMNYGVGGDAKHIEVDFTNIEPLYPHPGLDVPEGGVLFKSGGRLYCCGSNYFGYSRGGDAVFAYRAFDDSNKHLYEIKQQLPETKMICKDCGCEVCECSIEAMLIKSLRFIQEKASKYRENNLFARETDMYIENLLRNINPTPEEER